MDHSMKDIVTSQVLGTPDTLRAGRRAARSHMRGRQPQAQALADVRAWLGPCPPQGFARDRLIEYLHVLNDRHGALSRPHLVALAHDMNLPLLGVCRGLQVMAVAFGGSLVQHVPEASPLVHQERPGAFVHHDAIVDSGTMLAGIIGAGRVRINSSHHQCVRDLVGLTVNAHAEDGTIEGCEDSSKDFFLGVQWHPEEPDEPTGSLIFGALAAAAGARRSKRA